MAIGRSPDSEVPDVGDGLWERVRDAVQADAGADTSLWNGRLDYITRSNIRGSASANGQMRLNREAVVEPLQEMYATRGQPATQQQWVQRRNALKTTGHEFTHLASPADHSHADRSAEMGHRE